MPLVKGAKPGTKAFGRNIAAEINAGKKPSQAKAIAYSESRQSSNKGDHKVKMKSAHHKKAAHHMAKASAHHEKAAKHHEAAKKAMDMAKHEKMEKKMIGKLAKMHKGK